MGYEAKAELHRSLQMGRDAVVWKLDGLSEYDVRRPLTPTGTNLLGLLKHLASVEYGYFGVTFGRPADEPMPWMSPDAEPNADMYATADESRADIVELYRRANAHSDATIAALDLDAEGHVPWWPDDVNPVTLHQILVHLSTETHRHAGHADIVREMIDGAVGHRPSTTNLPDVEDGWWVHHVAHLDAVARAAGDR